GQRPRLAPPARFTCPAARTNWCRRSPRAIFACPRGHFSSSASSRSRTPRAPEGKHTAWAYTHGPRQGIDGDTELEGAVERIEAQVERFAPGFSDLILARHVMGPAELERRDRNLVGGDVGGGSYRLRQVVFRPVPGISPYRTPLHGLYLGSAATFPGGAVHGVPGDAAARAALADVSARR